MTLKEKRNKEISRHFKKVEMIKLAYSKAIIKEGRRHDRNIRNIEKECVKHEDDGSMFHGSCKNCGAFLE